MTSEGKNNTSVNNALRALRAFVNRAKKNGWYNGENPFKDFDRLPEVKTKPRWLDGEQIAKVLDVARAYSVNAHLFFALGLYAGLRKAEAEAARWTWINWRQKFIHVQGDEHFTIKNKQERTIPLNEKLAAILHEHRAKDGYIVAPDSLPGKYRYRFDIRKGFAAVVCEVGIDWLTPHVLRHTFASQLVQAGVNIFKVGQWLGHSDPTTTATLPRSATS